MVLFSRRRDGLLGQLAQGGVHSLRYVVVGLKAAWADAGPNGRLDIQGIASKFRLHGRYRLLDNSRRGAPPAGMDGANAPADRIKQENRSAVGGKDRQRYAGFVGDQPVVLAVAPKKQAGSTVLCSNPFDDAGVNLSGKDGLTGPKAHGAA